MSMIPHSPKAASPQEKKHLLHGVIIAGYAAFASLPVLIYGFIMGDDVLSHLVMSQNFVSQFWTGDAYPRWLFDLNAGLGSPVFHFYGPIPYYVTTLLHPLIGNDPEGWRQLGITASLAIAASGVTGYFWLKRFCNANAALIGAILYMTAPYHLAIDLYQRFALAELWAFVWMPLILMQAETSLHKTDRSIVALAIAYALLISTHLATTLLFSPILLIYALALEHKANRKSATFRIVSAMLLGIGLSAIYFVPAMATLDNIRLTDITTGHFHFAHHFLFADNYPSEIIENITTSVARFTTLTIVTTLVACLLGYGHLDRLGKRLAMFWLTIMSCAILMMLSISKPIWDMLPALQTIQFPWRLNTVVTLASTLLIAMLLSASMSAARQSRSLWLLAICMPLLLASIPSILVHTALARSVGHPSLDRLIEMSGTDNPDLSLRLAASKIDRYDSFLPNAAAPDLFLMSQNSLDTMAALGTQRMRLAAGNNAEARIKNWRPGKLLIETSAPSGGILTIHQFYYPGWSAHIAGQPSATPLRASQPEGLLELDVPPGSHIIHVSLETTRIERWGQIISTCAALLALLLIARKRPGKPTPDTSP